MTSNLSMVKFNKLIQGGKYKLQGGTLFLMKNTSRASLINFTKEGGIDNKFAMNKFLFFCFTSVKHVKKQGQAIKSLFQMNSV